MVKTEIPQFKRCCLCIPLRHGLLTWGYLNLVVTILALGFISFSIYEEHGFRSESLILTCMLLVIILNILFNILFIVGAHLKRHKLLKIFYYYSIAALAALVILIIYLWGHHISVIVHYHGYFFSSFFMFLLLGTSALILFIGLLQVYLIFLIRSEIFKLKDNRSFMFVNKMSNDPSCNMSVNDKELQEKAKYDRLLDDNDVIMV